jgi:hypothetical protein
MLETSLSKNNIGDFVCEDVAAILVSENRILNHIDRLGRGGQTRLVYKLVKIYDPDFNCAYLNKNNEKN